MTTRILSGALPAIRHSLIITLALALCPHETQAQSSSLTESAESVLRRVFADHYSDASKQLKSIVTSGTIEAFGLSGRFTSRFLAPDKHDLTLEFGKMDFAQGYDGRSAWMIDQNGSLLELSGHELKAIINGTYLSSRSFLAEHDFHGVREYLGPVTHTNRGCHEFRFFPAGGSEIEVIIDSLNGAVLRSITEIDGIREVTIYSDFRDAGGFPIAFNVQKISAVEQLNLTARVIECRVNVPLDPFSFTQTQAVFDDALFPAETDSVVVPIEISGGHLFVTVSVNGSTPKRFLLDSGAGASFLKAAAARELGLEVSGEMAAKGVAGYQTIGFAQINSIAIGDVELIDQTIGAIELPARISDALGDMSGALGYDFFSRLSVTIDFDASIMIMYKPSFFNLRVEREGYGGAYEFPLTFSGKAPLIDGTVSGSSGKFIIDLGSNRGILLHHSFAREAGLDTFTQSPGATAGAPGSLAGVGGSVGLRGLTLPEFSLAPLSFQNVTAWILADGQGMSASREIAGNLGAGFWKDFRLTLDYPSRRAFLLPQP